MGNNDKSVSLRHNVEWKNGERIAEILTGDQNKSGSVVPEFHMRKKGNSLDPILRLTWIANTLLYFGKLR